MDQQYIRNFAIIAQIDVARFTRSLETLGF